MSGAVRQCRPVSFLGRWTGRVKPGAWRPRPRRHRLEGLKNSEEYKAQGRIEDKRREVAARAAEVARQHAGIVSGRRRVAGLAEEVAKLSRRAADAIRDARAKRAYAD